MEEVRELYERDKRKCSIIIRGVGGVSCDEVREIFGRICTFLGVENIELLDLTQAAPSVWRGKVTNVSKRVELLSKAKNLKSSSEFSRIYIQRDLTYRQRRAIMAKRASFGRGTGANAVELGGEGNRTNVSHTPQLSVGRRDSLPNANIVSNGPSRSGEGSNSSARSSRVPGGSAGGQGDPSALSGGELDAGRGRGARGGRGGGRGARGRGNRFTTNQVRRNF